jgi:hypothetical protein
MDRPGHRCRPALEVHAAINQHVAALQALTA